MIKILLLVGTGSFIGGIARFALGRFIQSFVSSNFPWGTFAVNVSGSFIIGILFGLAMRDNLIPVEWKIFLVTGICGGFTTFSTFSMENLELLRTGHIQQFFLYALSSVVVALLATFLGFSIARG